MLIILSLVLLTVAFIIIVNVLQTNKPNLLPLVLRSWNFLPKFLRSLEPYDRIMSGLLCCKKFKTEQKISPMEENIVNLDIYSETKVIDIKNDTEALNKPIITITKF